MRKVKKFKHLLLKDFEELKGCTLYEIKPTINK